jgi:arginyl-tRNA--protein-N-Asp/Glu arginylyltransferase
MAKVFRSFNSMTRRISVPNQDMFEFLYAVLFRGNEALAEKGTAVVKLAKAIKLKLDAISEEDNTTNSGRRLLATSQKVELTSEEYNLMERYLEAIHIPISYDFADKGINLFETAEKHNGPSEARSEN